VFFLSISPQSSSLSAKRAAEDSPLVLTAFQSLMSCNVIFDYRAADAFGALAATSPPTYTKERMWDDGFGLYEPFRGV
jgi:hypothetical protein